MGKLVPIGQLALLIYENIGPGRGACTAVITQATGSNSRDK